MYAYVCISRAFLLGAYLYGAKLVQAIWCVGIQVKILNAQKF